MLRTIRQDLQRRRKPPDLSFVFEETTACYWLRVFGRVAFGRKALESLTLRRIA